MNKRKFIFQEDKNISMKIANNTVITNALTYDNGYEADTEYNEFSGENSSDDDFLLNKI